MNLSFETGNSQNNELEGKNFLQRKTIAFAGTIVTSDNAPQIQYHDNHNELKSNYLPTCCLRLMHILNSLSIFTREILGISKEILGIFFPISFSVFFFQSVKIGICIKQNPIFLIIRYNYYYHNIWKLLRLFNAFMISYFL